MDVVEPTAHLVATKWHQLFSNNTRIGPLPAPAATLLGSVLGPLLFLLYINALSKNTEDISKPVLHADDTSIL
jgi:hypothetical protein